MKIVNGGNYKYVHYTISELMNVGYEEFVTVLANHTLGEDYNPDEFNEAYEQYINKVPYNFYDEGEVKKIRSWLDCLDYLKKYFSEVSLESIGNISVVFEYQLPEETWMDVIIIYENRIMLLEFKSGRNSNGATLEKYIYQLDEYYNSFAGSNLNVIIKRKNNVQFNITQNLVFTNQEMEGKTPEDERVIVTDAFRELIYEFGSPMDFDEVESLINFDEGFDSDTVDVVQNILNSVIINSVYTEDDNVLVCRNIVDNIIESRENDRLNILVVKGTPSAGKTGTALSLLQKYYGTGNTPTKYITGNNNLYNVFKKSAQSRRQPQNDGVVIPFNHIFGMIHSEYSLEWYCLKNDPSVRDKNQTRGLITNNVILVDESQRMWSGEMLSFAMDSKTNISVGNNRKQYANFALEKNLTEAYLLLYELMRAIVYKHRSKILVLFVGNGQSIYRGEDGGEKAIYEAINKIGDLLSTSDKLTQKINLYVPDSGFEPFIKNENVNVITEPGLKIEGNKRDSFNPNSSIFIDQLIEHRTITISKTEIGRSFKLYRSMDDIMDDLSEIHIENIKSGILQSSFDSAFNAPSVVQNRSLSPVGPDDRYAFFNKNNKFLYNKYATQFDSQDLELDRVIFIWGKGITGGNTDWNYSYKALHTNKKYFENVNDIYARCNMRSPYTAQVIEQLEKEFARNSYRVLLTRATTMTHILVEDQNTYNYLHQFIPAYGD